MNRKTWIIFILIVVAVVGGMIYLSTQNRLDVSDIAKDSSSKVIGPEDRNGNIGDHVFGNPDSKVLFIEYGDFQCNPGCRLFHENFSPIMQDPAYKDKIKFVFRNFPITQAHPNAIAASTAAEAAGLQNKYWEMWDVIFANQAEWSAASALERGSFFDKYATELKLDLNKFHEDMQSENISKKIQFDRALGMAVGVQGTPTTFLNGEQVKNEDIASTEAIKKILDKAIKEAN